MAPYVPRHSKDGEEVPAASSRQDGNTGDADGVVGSSVCDAKGSRAARTGRGRAGDRAVRRTGDRAIRRAGSRAGGDAVGGPAAKPRTRSLRFRLSLALGIVFIVIALVIGVFLAYKYLSAGQQASQMRQAVGMDLGTSEVPLDTGLDVLDINWEALKAINPDIVGWVLIPGTRINYPIVQAGDNDFYLNHLFDKTYSEAGAIFLDGENDSAIAGQNNIVYGHNLIDGSMFAGLKAYREQDFFDAHRTILLATPEMNYRLEVGAALVCDADDKIRRFGFTDRADYDAYVEMLLGYAAINALPAGEVPERLYCFATCTDVDYSKRVMIVASVAEATAATGSAEATAATGSATDEAATGSAADEAPATDEAASEGGA